MLFYRFIFCIAFLPSVIFFENITATKRVLKIIFSKNNLLSQLSRETQNNNPPLPKITQTKKETFLKFSQEVRNYPNYQRDLIKTHLSTPEWFNVSSAQEYGKFINHTPFYKFPYMKSVTSFWDTFIKSWKIAASKKGHFKVLSNEYTLMNVFVGTFMTFEYAIKALISAPIRWKYSGEEPQTIQLIIDDPKDEISTLDDLIKTIKTDNNSTLKLVEIPRYKNFFEIMHKTIPTAVKTLEIAGQKEIQCNVRYAEHLNIEELLASHNYKKDFTWTLPPQTGFTYAAITVPVDSIKEAIETFQTNDIELLHLHDY